MDSPKTIRLAEMARNPVVAAFFCRGERDSGETFAVPAPKAPVLTDGMLIQVSV